jgi:hypothetical protein
MRADPIPDELDPADEVEAMALYRIAEAIEKWEDMLPPGEVREELQCFRAYCVSTSSWLRDPAASATYGGGPW